MPAYLLRTPLAKGLPWGLFVAVMTSLVLVLGQAPPAYGAGLVVNSTDDTTVAGDGKCTLREAINNANSNSDATSGDCTAGSGADTITFSVTGTIRLGSELPAISNNLTITGPGAASLTISGDTNNDGTGDVPVLTVNTAVTFTLQSVTVAKGFRAGNGGAIQNSGTLTVTNSTFSGNSAVNGGDGGGISSASNFFVTTLNVIGSTFSDNSAEGRGGAIFSSVGTVTVIDSTISGNNAGLGGGVSKIHGTLTVTNSTFTDNSATTGGGIDAFAGTQTVTNSTFAGNSANEGGGIYSNSGTLTVTSSTFSGNSSGVPGPGGGGAIYHIGAPLVVTNSTFSDNSATSGGGIFNQGPLNVTNTTFSGNSSSNHGGGIFNTGTLTVTNSTFSDNGSGLGGGGITNGGGTLNVTNSTFSGNGATSGGGIWNNSTATLRNTIIANSTSGGNCDGAITNGGGNLRWPSTDASCVGAFGDPKLGPLANNGGPTQTMALLPGSAAIDTGINTICAAAPVNNLDQRGQPRPTDGDGNGTAVCDIGAYELAPTISGVDLSLTKTDSPDPVAPGGLLTYNLVVTKPATGSATATGVFVTETLPTGVTFSSATPSQGAYNSGAGIWTVGTLGTTGSATMALKVTVGAAVPSGTVLTNTAVVKADQPDPNPANNTAVTQTTVQAPPVNFADLALTKTDSPDPVAPGALLTYSLKVTNAATGSATAIGVFVTETLPAGVTFSSATPSQGSYNSGTGVWSVGTLTASGSATMQLKVTVGAAVPSGTVLTNTGVVKADQPDPNPANNTAVAQTKVELPGDVEPPTCRTVDAFQDGKGRLVVRFLFEDVGSGLARVDLTRAVNADVRDVRFPEGPADPMVMTLRQGDPAAGPMNVRFRLTDRQGNRKATSCRTFPNIQEPTDAGEEPTDETPAED